VSRAEHHPTTRRRVLTGLVPSVLGLGLAAVLTGCGAGQITQTDTQTASIDGANATVGQIAVRDTYLAFPNNPQGVYQPGSTARLVVTIVNTGLPDDTLVKAASPGAASVTIDGSPSGSKLIPGGFSIASYPPGIAGAQPTTAGASSQQSSGEPGSGTVTTTPGSGAGSASSVPPGVPNGSGNVSAAPPTPTSAIPVLPHQVTIELVDIRSINGGQLRAGLTIPITFYFAHAGQITLPRVPIGPAPAGNTQGS
jgi:hypothetical protein